MKTTPRSPRHHFTKLVLIALAILSHLHAAPAALRWDVRVVSVTPGTGSIIDPKTVFLLPSATGTITFEVWATVRGVDANIDETLTSGQYELMSSPGVFSSGVTVDATVPGNSALSALGVGALKGNLANALVVPWRTTSTARDGASQDLDGDGDLDVGSLFNGASLDHIQANGGGQQSSGAPGNFVTLPDGREWKISVATFAFDTATSLENDATGINVVIPRFTSALRNNARASFSQDLVVKTGTSANLEVGVPLVVTVVPEPSVVVMLALGGLSLARRRRPVAE